MFTRWSVEPKVYSLNPTSWSMNLGISKKEKRTQLPTSKDKTGKILEELRLWGGKLSPRCRATWAFDYHPNQVNGSSQQRLSLCAVDDGRRQREAGQTEEMIKGGYQWTASKDSWVDFDFIPKSICVGFIWRLYWALYVYQIDMY